MGAEQDLELDRRPDIVSDDVLFNVIQVLLIAQKGAGNVGGVVRFSLVISVPVLVKRVIVSSIIFCSSLCSSLLC